MTYYHLLNSVPAFQKLIHQDLPLRTAYRLSKMVRKVNEELDFFRAKQEEIQAKHEYQIPQSEFEALLAFEVEWEEPRIEIALDDSIMLSVTDVDALTPFIDFKEVNNDAEN